MKRFTVFLLLNSAAVITLAPNPSLAQSPPYSGTVFIDSDILSAGDPTTFVESEYIGQASRLVFDRRVNRWLNMEMFLFSATFSDGLSSEIRVNPEFGSMPDAATEADKFAAAVGRLPKALRRDVDSLTIHDGEKPFGGGNRNILIHAGQAELRGDFLEEVLIHEAAHTSLDADHASADQWLEAADADGKFISNWARDFPQREDIAESFLAWLAVRHRSSRIDAVVLETIEQTIPNRLAYFDSLSLDLSPVVIEAMFGDLDGDSTLTDNDIDLLSAAVRNGSLNQAFDLTGDGNIDRQDREFWVQNLANTFFGDANLDQQVEFGDFLVLSGNFSREVGWASGDFDGSGRAEFADFLLLSANFGNTRMEPSGVVPEANLPASLSISLGVIIMLRRKARRADEQQIDFEKRRLGAEDF